MLRRTWNDFAGKALVHAWKVCLFIVIYLNLYAFFGQDALPPNGPYFHLFVVLLLAHLLGELSELVGLPSLFGKLVAGKSL